MEQTSILIESSTDLVDGNLLRGLLRCRLRESNVEDSMLHGGLDFVRFDSDRELQGTGETAVGSLTDGVPFFVTLGARIHFPGDGETVMMNVDIDVFFFQTGEFEGGCYSIRLSVLLNVHPVCVCERVKGGGRLLEDKLYIPWLEGHFPRRITTRGSTLARGRETRSDRVIEEAVEFGEGVVVERSDYRHLFGVLL